MTDDIQELLKNPAQKLSEEIAAARLARAKVKLGVFTGADTEAWWGLISGGARFPGRRDARRILMENLCRNAAYDGNPLRQQYAPRLSGHVPVKLEWPPLQMSLMTSQAPPPRLLRTIRLRAASHSHI